jgi:hypothetical protein
MTGLMRSCQSSCLLDLCGDISVISRFCCFSFCFSLAGICALITGATVAPIYYGVKLRLSLRMVLPEIIDFFAILNELTVIFCGAVLYLVR